MRRTILSKQGESIEHGDHFYERRFQDPKKILVVIGTRPEAIKMAPVIRELHKHPARIQYSVCSTGQHRELLEDMVQLFGIVPDWKLDLMKTNQGLSDLAAMILQGIQKVIDRFKPDWMLLQGDTTTVAAASLAAFYSRVKVGHIEAGLRTHDKSHPFPEEINRRLAANLADLHFAPTEQASCNLLAEGVNPEHILVTGNTVVDALRWAADQPFDESLLPVQLNAGGKRRPARPGDGAPAREFRKATGKHLPGVA